MVDYYPYRIEIVVRSKIEQIGNLLSDYFFSGNSLPLTLGREGSSDSKENSLEFVLYGLTNDFPNWRTRRLVVRGYESRTVLLIKGWTVKEEDREKITELSRNIIGKMEFLGIEIISFEPPDLQTSSSLELWERIPVNGKDQMIVKYWNEGDTNKMIAKKLDFDNILSVTNAVSKLRRDNPGLVLTDEERRRIYRKNG